MTDDEMIEAMARAIVHMYYVDPINVNFYWKLYADQVKVALNSIKPEIDRRVAEARNAALEEAAREIDSARQRTALALSEDAGYSAFYLEGKREAAIEHAAMVRGFKS